MGYKKPENQWNNLSKVEIVERSDNSQLRVSVTYKEGDIENPYLSIREFAKYLTKEERAMGLALEAAIFRPTSNGVTCPLFAAEDLIKALQKVFKEADKRLTKEGINYKGEE